jgi:DNA-directed RNA polymerase subunit H (RpoH/RPB5)
MAVRTIEKNRPESAIGSKAKSDKMANASLRNWSREIVVLERMLLDRGCQQLQLLATGEEPVLLCSLIDEGGNKMHVYISNQLKVGVKMLRKLRDEAERHEVGHVLLACPSGLTPFALKIHKEASESTDNPVMEVFKKQELGFCVPYHCLVPKHTALSSVEKKKVLDYLKCRTSSLPKLKESDPVAKYYRYPVGTVVKIERYIGGTEGDIYFRVVSS